MKIFDVTIAISDKVPIYSGDPAASVEAVNQISRGAAANVSKDVLRCPHRNAC